MPNNRGFMNTSRIRQLVPGLRDTTTGGEVKVYKANANGGLELIRIEDINGKARNGKKDKVRRNANGK